MTRLFINVVTLVLLTACISRTPHQNFVSIMRSQIDSNADDPNSYTGAYHRYRISEKKLENGNIEEEYERGEKCRHFFEINSKTRIIVGWRFEGNEEDCVIVP